MKKLHSTLVAASLILAVSLTQSCSDSGGGSNDDPSSSSGNNLLLNFTSNYADGVLRWMNTNDTVLDAGEITDFDQDSKVFAHNGKIFVLERPLSGTPSTAMNDGVLNCLSPVTGQPVPYGSDSLAHGSNPYDIAFIGTTGYIAQYGIDSVRIFNTTNCQLGGNIQLPDTVWIQNSSSSAVAATTNAVSIKTDGTKLYVVMQTWVIYPPDTVQANRQAANGILVRIHLNDNNRRDSIVLNYINPQSSVLANGKLYIGSTNDLGTVDKTKSGIEVVNSVGGTSIPTSTSLVAGTALGGGSTDIVLGESGYLYTTVYRTWGDVLVKRVSLNDGTISNPNPLPNIDDATCLVFDNEKNNLFIGNGAPYSTVSDPSLKIYNQTKYPTTIDVEDSRTIDGALPPLFPSNSPLLKKTKLQNGRSTAS